MNPSLQDILQRQGSSQDEEVRAWLESRPPAIREVAEKLNGEFAYRLQYDGVDDLVFIYSYYETANGVELKVRFFSGLNPGRGPDRLVFGIKPEWLTRIEWDDLIPELKRRGVLRAVLGVTSDDAGA